MRRRSLLIPAAAAAAVALAVAGCGGSSVPAKTAAASAPGSGVATIKTATTGLGTFLVDGEGRTLYLWKADTGSMSTCDGACAEAWPPATTSGAPKASGGVKGSLLGTTKRSDGTLEVTYAGHPLYRYAGDAKPGDTAGQGSDGFGADWLVVQPSGSAIDES
jgi:predicted lipoprotein with Yx(FWY)xxD motif